MSVVTARWKFPPHLAYHVLRCSLEGFKKNIAQLNPEEYKQVLDKARKTHELESLALSSNEARGLVISERQLDASVDEIVSRYASREDFHADLDINGLTPGSLRIALRRELMFNSVLQKVVSNVAVTEIDVRLFFEMHQSRFETPEQREARHLLITVNEQFAENTASAALQRIQEIRDKLDGRGNRFADFARRYSECPTAIEGGKLGVVSRGQLFPSLDEVLFELQEKEIGPVVESEMGYHLLLCEKIRPRKKAAFSRVESGIREILRKRLVRNSQKQWLESLKEDSGGV
ncbi:MAG: nitrogen fixation protein NifM [Gammaproteobacteria bacterium]|nr:nitrogen fixation protein NifM [Gammaproteobacteria bacterium]